MKGFVNFPFVKFKKSKLHDWAKRKYIDSEEIRGEVVEYFLSKYARLYSENKKFASGVLNGVFDFDLSSETVYNLIKIFTYKEIDETKVNELIEELSSMGITAQIQDEVLSISSDDLSFNVCKLSKLEPNFLNVLTDIEQPSRGGKCHQYALVVARVYANSKAFDTHLVTGEVYQVSRFDRYMHSWVEIFDGEKTFVIDPTRNAVYSKEAFYKINHVGKVVKIHSSEVKRDLGMIMALFEYDGLLSKVYFENPEKGRKLYRKLVEIGEIKESKQEEKS